MYRRIIKNDILQSKLITLTTTVFIAIAALLVSLAIILSVNLSGSIDTLMEKAESPHYMQMHAGNLDEDRLKQFAKNNKEVETYETSKFLNIDGSKIKIEDFSFANSVEDNGVTTQNKKLDYLLNMDNQRIKVKPGELYAPVLFKKQGIAKVGDKVTIAGMKFRITGFCRDGSMNSAISGSRRFLIHKNEYDKLSRKGSIEYLIQFRLKDLSKLNNFEASYKKANLETNGPTGTYRLFKLANAMSDGLMIAILLLISLLVVFMAFMCIRFTLLAKIEEEYKEIGVMKAIGLEVKNIKVIYLAKYAVIAVIGSLLGLFFSLPLSYLLLKNIKLVMGESSNEQLSKIIAPVGVILVMILIIVYVSLLLNRFNKISAVEAIRFSGSNEKANTKTHFNLRKLSVFTIDFKIGIIDIFSRKKIYLTMLLVFILSAFIMIVPAITYKSISSETFIESLGYSKKVDLTTSLYESANSIEHEELIESYLKKDSDVKTFSKIITKNFNVKDKDSADNILSVELGNHKKFPIEYVDGKAPLNSNEIALSTINAEEFKKEVGDSLTLLSDGKEKKFTVSGIYANLFNGGKTAKANFKNQNSERMWTSFYIDFKPTANLDQKKSDYEKALPFAKLYNLLEYRDQTYGSLIRSLFLASIGSLLVAVLITGLVTALFMKLLITRDRKEIATIKALGFSNKDISNQYLSRSLVVLIIGLGLGTILSMTLGKVLAGMLVSSFGGTSIKFTGNLLIYLVCPLLMLAVTTLTTKLVTLKAGKIDIAKNLKD